MKTEVPTDHFNVIHAKQKMFEIVFLKNKILLINAQVQNENYES